MSNVVFILGAGASQQAGAPLLKDFLDIARSLLLTGKVKPKEEHFKRVFQAIGQLQAVYSKSTIDLTNIESVFNAFEIANIIQKLPGFKPEEIPTVITSLKELIVQTLELSMLFLFRLSRKWTFRPFELDTALVQGRWCADMPAAV